MNIFEPIAIIGRACLLPGAHTPLQLWQNTLAGVDCLDHATTQLWGIDPARMLYTGNENKTTDLTWTDRAGYIKEFENLFNPNGFYISPQQIKKWDVLHQWLLHTGRNALHDAGYALKEMESHRAGAIIGNLSYPIQSLSQFAESVWLKKQTELKEMLDENVFARDIHPENRFMSGLPIHKMAQGLGLTGDAFAIDAACASSLYAIKLACDQLQDGSSDLMLAGGVNAADSLFLQMGFTALQALSKTGRSLPFHREADGLIPAQGVALVVLKRLEDAIAEGHQIYGVIRGIGLSNDGTGNGLLVPHSPGQVAAMQQAYAVSGLTPEDVSWVECHATGTSLGDATEIRSMQQVFQQLPIEMGALKANIGHSITASGAAALINVLSAFASQTKPPTRAATLDPSAIVKESGFRLLEKPEPWDSKTKTRCAAINCFGFGGNNAHLLVEEWRGTSIAKKRSHFVMPADSNMPIAIVGLGIMAGGTSNKTEFAEALWGERNATSELGGHIAEISLPIKGTPFPPADLERTLGQQLALLKASQEALADIEPIAPHRTAVLVGMQCDAEITRSGLRWRLPALFPQAHQSAWLDEARQMIHWPLQSADVIGCMPNIVANRLNHVFNFKAPSYSISDEELSGITALKIAIRDLQNHNIDMAVIGAVDMCCEDVHQTAARAVLNKDQQIPGDAAVVMVLKRLDDAQKAGDNIYGVIPSKPETSSLRVDRENSPITRIFGHAHAASGLLHVAAATLACYEKLLLPTKQSKSLPWLTTKARVARVHVSALNRKQATIAIQEDITQKTRISHLHPSIPQLFVYSGEDKKAVLEALKTNHLSQKGPSKLVLVAHDSQELLKQQEIAHHYLSQDGSEPLPNGIYFREQPLYGDIAFVFTGALTTYPKMGWELLRAWPHLLNELTAEVKSLSHITDCLYPSKETTSSLNMFEELKTYSFLSQIHAQFSQQLLGIKPNACIGYCSGETNGLIAMKAWRDMEQLFLDVGASEMYTDTLAGNYSVLGKNWQPCKNNQQKWSAWRVMADVKVIEEAVKTEPFVRLTIINSPNDCIIAGQPDACTEFLKRIPHSQAKALPHNMIIHCQEFAPMSNQWRQLHYRKTYAPNAKFYSTGTGQPYEVTAETAADALLSQAAARVDFPRVISNAWKNGVRIFLEHGPRHLCTHWIKEILGEKNHLAVSLDMMGINPVTQAAYATAQLVAAGVGNINLGVFSAEKIN